MSKLVKYVRTALFSGKNYTSDKNFTRPPVATVATNSKSEFWRKQHIDFGRYHITTIEALYVDGL